MKEGNYGEKKGAGGTRELKKGGQLVRLENCMRIRKKEEKGII